MPQEKPNEQQTASLFSLIFFNWVNGTIGKASRVSHLSLDELPALADTNYTKNLAEKSFPVCICSSLFATRFFISAESRSQQIDPFQLGKEEHIFWGFVRVYRKSKTASG